MSFHSFYHGYSNIAHNDILTKLPCRQIGKDKIWTQSEKQLTHTRVIVKFKIIKAIYPMIFFLLKEPHWWHILWNVYLHIDALHRIVYIIEIGGMILTRNIYKIGVPLVMMALSLIARFTGLTWDSPGSCRPQVGPMLAPWTFPYPDGVYTPAWSVHSKATLLPLPLECTLQPHSKYHTCTLGCHSMDFVKSLTNRNTLQRHFKGTPDEVYTPLPLQ